MDFSIPTEEKQAVPPSRLGERQAEDIWRHCRERGPRSHRSAGQAKEGKEERRKKRRKEDGKEGGREGPKAAVSS